MASSGRACTALWSSCPRSAAVAFAPRYFPVIVPARRVHDVMIWLDLAADQRLAEAQRRVDRALGAPAAHRVGGEQHACGFRLHHRLHDDREGDALLRDGVPGAVAERAGRPQAAPAPHDRVLQRFGARHVQVGVLLPGKGKIGQVFSGGRRAHGDGRVVPEYVAVCDADGRGELRGHGAGQEPRRGLRRTRLRARPDRPASARRVSRRRRPGDRLPPTKAAYAAVVTINPGGTGKPPRISRDRFAAFPPADRKRCGRGVKREDVGCWHGALDLCRWVAPV